GRPRAGGRVRRADGHVPSAGRAWSKAAWTGRDRTGTETVGTTAAAGGAGAGLRPLPALGGGRRGPFRLRTDGPQRRAYRHLSGAAHSGHAAAGHRLRRSVRAPAGAGPPGAAPAPPPPRILPPPSPPLPARPP